MVYSTHINIEKEIENGSEYWQVEGIEYPNLITDGKDVEEAIEMARDAWTLLCVVYEDKNVDIEPLDNKFEEIFTENKVTTIIDSFDTDVYRDEMPDN